jgi:hypothetical protein
MPFIPGFSNSSGVLNVYNKNHKSLITGANFLSCLTFLRKGNYLVKKTVSVFMLVVYLALLAYIAPALQQLLSGSVIITIARFAPEFSCDCFPTFFVLKNNLTKLQ